MADNGGLAFPTGQSSHPDMDLRDWYAWRAAEMELRNHATLANPYQDNCRLLARRAYMFADAMLAERAKKGGAA